MSKSKTIKRVKKFGDSRDLVGYKGNTSTMPRRTHYMKCDGKGGHVSTAR